MARLGRRGTTAFWAAPPEGRAGIHVRRLSDNVYLATGGIGLDLSAEAETPEEARRLLLEVALDLIEKDAEGDDLRPSGAQIAG